MNEKELRPNVTHRVSFTAEEDEKIRKEAEKAGLTVTAYIRQKALSGNVRSVDWKRLQLHTEAIQYIAEEVRVYTSDKNPNVWLFATDLDLIAEKLDDLVELELKLIGEICRGE